MKSQTLKRLLSYIKGYKGSFSAGVILALIGTAFTILAPKLLGEITSILYDGVSDGVWYIVENSDGSIDTSSVYTWLGGKAFGKLDLIVAICVTLTIMYGLALVFCNIANKILSNVTANMVKDIRTDINKKMHRITLNYYDTRTNGEILSVITNDVDAVNTMLSKNLYQIITQAFTLVGIIIMLFLTNVWMALIAIATIPITIFIAGPVQIKSGKYFGAQQNQLGDVNGYVEEMYNGHNVITSFNCQERVADRFRDMNNDLRGKAQKAEQTSGSVMPLAEFVNNIGYAAAALVGCLFAINGTLSVGSVQSVIQYIKTFQQPLFTVAQMSGQFSAAMASGTRIFELLDAEEEIPDPEDGKVPTVCDGSVSFDHVAFGYRPDHLLMTDVNFQAKPGQKVAIVGPTGAGKTTLINLLMRFYEINGGDIIVDGVSTKEMTRQELRKHFGMVLQETWLFEGTIRDNLTYSTNREVSDEEIEAATKSVCADTFIKTMPGGYDMVLSKGAENISQGQRQLLTIARAILTDPEIMILDEATSNVDAHTEQAIQTAMAALMKGRTSFVIAHRLSTIRDAAVILYMENGDIKEVGDHDTLMKLGGKYADLYNSQFG